MPIKHLRYPSSRNYMASDAKFKRNTYLHSNLIPLKHSKMLDSVEQFLNAHRSPPLNYCNAKKHNRSFMRYSIGGEPIQRKSVCSIPHPLFLISRNANSRMVNTKTTIGWLQKQLRGNINIVSYRRNRGDHTTIVPTPCKHFKPFVNSVPDNKYKDDSCLATQVQWEYYISTDLKIRRPKLA